MSYLHYLCLFAQSDGQRILCCAFVLFSSSCVPYCPVYLDCPFLLLPLRYSLTFIVIKHGTVCLPVHPFSFYFLLVQCRQSFG